MKLHFLGANQQVTGSCYMLETNGSRVVIDCGMFQERPFLERNWRNFPFEPASIDAMLLTHAHLDHCGRIPRLVQQGFEGRIHTVEPSVELAAIVLRDSARLQREDIRFKRKRHRKEGRHSPHPYTPLYTEADAEQSIRQLTPHRYGRPVKLPGGLTAVFHEAGHILGSAMVSIQTPGRDGAASRRLLFSGDIGQWDKPLIEDPTLFDQADLVVMESTYGDREHREEGPVEERLAEIISDAVEAGGNIVIPTFAIERAQELLYHLSILTRAKRIPRLPVFLDSPMAVNVTDVFKRYRTYLDDPTQELLNAGHNPLAFPGLRLTRTRRASQSINAIRGTCIILAGSGMCTGGRIKHHLVHNIERPESTLLFVGYQSPYTLGGQIVRGDKQVRIFGSRRDVRARVRQLHGMSAHADRSDLVRWAASLKSPPDRLFLTHGDEDAARSLAEAIEAKIGRKPEIPAYEQAVDVD